MMEFEISDSFPVPPQVVYDNWLDSEAHTAITGSPATASNEVGGELQPMAATSMARTWSWCPAS